MLLRILKVLTEDFDRLNKCENALQNPSRLSIKSRNERIAEKIAPIMGISEDEAYKKIREVSQMRGKHLHELENNWNELEASEKFLQKTIENYLKKSF